MHRYKIEIQGKEYTIDVEDVDADHLRVTLDHQTYDLSLSSIQDLAKPASESAAQPMSVQPAVERPAPSSQPARREIPQGPGAMPAPTPLAPAKGFRPTLTAPMPGTIQEILVKPGDRVERGQTIVVLEAMKMKNTIKSAQSGIIGRVVAEIGKPVRYGDVLVCFEEPTP